MQLRKGYSANGVIHTHQRKILYAYQFQQDNTLMTKLSFLMHREIRLVKWTENITNEAVLNCRGHLHIAVQGGRGFDNGFEWWCWRFLVALHANKFWNFSFCPDHCFKLLKPHKESFLYLCPACGIWDLNFTFTLLVARLVVCHVLLSLSLQCTRTDSLSQQYIVSPIFPSLISQAVECGNVHTSSILFPVERPREVENDRTTNSHFVQCLICLMQ